MGTLIAYVIVIAVVDWAVLTLVPLKDPYDKIVHVVCVLAALFAVLHGTGLIHGSVDM